MTTQPPQLKKKDFESDQQVRWCPGCGDYAILSSVQKTFAELGLRNEEVAVISGIGCAARFPYYVNSYGFHTIHGRAPALATGLKIARPDLSVWVVGGDGDMLSIGGNHLLHALRRNIDINIMCFDNRIYGLTKGQASPTSEFGKRTATTPMGSLDRPVNPISVALAAEGTFVARTADVFAPHLQAMLTAAAAHKGVAFIQILQNCIIFNDRAFAHVTDREAKNERVLYLEHGAPMIFGKEKDKGIRLVGNKPEVVRLGEDGITEKDILVHDETDESLAYMLSRLDPKDFPTPLGIFRRAGAPSLHEGYQAQFEQAKSKDGEGVILDLIHSGDVWDVK